MKRLVQPELLDSLPPADPRALRSRRDLRRVNAWMQNHSLMAGVLKKHLPAAPKKISELGAGDGNFLLRVAQKTGWQNVNALLTDLQKNVAVETIAEFSRLDWRAETIVADVFDLPASAADDVIIANLFLHHFEDDRLKSLFEKISRRTPLFIAIEPHRFHFPFPCAQMLRLIGCNDVTLHDAEISIRAGFIRQEISALWPDQPNWRLTEHRAGLFSHLFIARKIQ